MSLKNGIEKLSETMDKLGLAEITIEQSFLFGIWKKEIHLSKTTKNIQQMMSTPIISAPKLEVIEEPQKSENTVKAPMVGVAYLSPEPKAKPFIEVGQTIKEGDTICLIEAMKTFNPVKSTKSGVIKKILIKDSEIVEYDTPLIVIE